MDSITWLHLLVYFSYLFITGVYAWRTVKYARMPVHLRWDLYPLPGEKGREYGGSYLEEINWWEKYRPSGLMRNIVYIVKDYLSFMQYFQRNRPYWFVLYPTHVGFYLIFLLHVLMLFGGITLAFGIPVSAEAANIWGVALYYVTLVVGVSGFFIGAAGCIGLLAKRLMDKDQREFTPPMYYFNYIFFLAMFVSGAYAWLLHDPTFTVYREFWKSLVTISPLHVDAATIVHIVLFSLFLIYMPFTRAMHYITKFFTFFAIRWNDTPNFRGSKMEGKIQKNLGKHVSWSASHIQTGKTWAEVATEVKYPDEPEAK